MTFYGSFEFFSFGGDLKEAKFQLSGRQIGVQKDGGRASTNVLLF
jgi:hypothetical protein